MRKRSKQRLRRRQEEWRSFTQTEATPRQIKSGMSISFVHQPARSTACVGKTPHWLAPLPRSRRPGCWSCCGSSGPASPCGESGSRSRPAQGCPAMRTAMCRCTERGPLPRTRSRARTSSGARACTAVCWCPAHMMRVQKRNTGSVRCDVKARHSVREDRGGYDVPAGRRVSRSNNPPLRQGELDAVYAPTRVRGHVDGTMRVRGSWHLEFVHKHVLAAAGDCGRNGWLSIHQFDAQDEQVVKVQLAGGWKRHGEADTSNNLMCEVEWRGTHSKTTQITYDWLWRASWYFANTLRRVEYACPN
jgi:hypothetical protein